MGKVNMAAILDKKPEEIEKPPVLPMGAYTWVIEKPHEFNTRGDNGQFEIVSFPVKVVAVGDDVDPDDVAAYGEKADINQARNRVEFFFNGEDEESFTKTENRLKAFLQDHLKCWEDGTPLRQGLADAVGQQFLGTIKHQPDKNDPETIYARIDKTMALD